jgi:hypothetical protein
LTLSNICEEKNRVDVIYLVDSLHTITYPSCVEQLRNVCYLLRESIQKDERGMQCRQFSIFEILLPLIFRVLGYEFLDCRT